MAEGSGFQLVAAGRLLVANPLLPDPNFDRTVVLLLAYSTDGAVGLVLNRPSDTQLGVPLPRWEPYAADPPVVFVGGPVQHQAVICLGKASGPPTEHGSEAPEAPEVPGPQPLRAAGGLVAGEARLPGGDGGDGGPGGDGGDGGDRGWRPLTPELGTIDLDGDPEEAARRFSQVRVFAGYAGWGAGQLEGEIEAGAWWVVDADAGDAFSDRPTSLWKAVLRRQGGPLALVASYPDDPTAN